jgi:hypothetical protein
MERAKRWLGKSGKPDHLGSTSVINTIEAPRLKAEASIKTLP